MSHAQRRLCPTPSRPRFPSPESADVALKKLQERGRGDGQQVYGCCCSHWHVGALTVALRHKIKRAVPRPPFVVLPVPVDVALQASTGRQLVPAGEALRIPVRGKRGRR